MLRAESDGNARNEVFHQRFQPPRIQAVVRRRPHEIFASRLREHELEIGRGAAIFILAQVTDARVAGGIFQADRPSGICRCVIGDHQLEVGEGLAENRIQSVADVFLAVVDGETNADFRLPAHKWITALASNDRMPQGRCRAI